MTLSKIPKLHTDTAQWRYVIAFCAIMLSASHVQAQLTVTEATTSAEVISLVENVFVGNCVEVSNVIFTGFADNAAIRGAAGSFANGNTTNLGLEDGILITSGRASLAVGPDIEYVVCGRKNTPIPSPSPIKGEGSKKEILQISRELEIKMMEAARRFRKEPTKSE